MGNLSITDLIGEVNLDLPWFLDEPNPQVYLQGPWLVLDFETTNLDKGSALNPNNRLVCAAWATSFDHKIKYKYAGEFEQGDLLLDIADVLHQGGFIIAHNAKFELHWLHRMGVDLYNVITYDTMLGEYVRGGNRWMYQHLSLDKLHKKYGGSGKMKIVDAMIKGGVCPSMIPEYLLKARVTKDIADTIEVFHGQVEVLAERDQLAVAWTRNLVTPCLTWVETRGIGLNRDRVYEEYQRAYADMQQLNAELDKFTGGINWRSVPQKAKFLYGKKSHKEEALQVPNGLGFEEPTRYGGKKIRNKASKQFPNGVPKTDDKTLAKLKAKSQRQKKFLELLKRAGKINAQLTKTLEFFKGVVDEYDGTFYGVFNQFNTATHRLSSSGRKIYMEQFETEKSAQFQNMARIFKDLMQAKRDGWLMAEADGSQLEFRVAAFLGNDTTAKQDIRGDVDIHKFTGAVIHHAPKEWLDNIADHVSDIVDLMVKVTKAERQDSKEHTFKPTYGGSSGTPREKAYYAAFRAKYNELYDEQTSWTFDVLKNKKLRTSWGMEYHWPRTRMSQDGFIDNTPSIFNYPVQALATAEIIPVALVYLWQRLRANHAKAELVNTVHDSAIAEIPPEEAGLWQQLSLQCFTFDVYKYLKQVYDMDFDVPLGAGIVVGQRWNSPDCVETEVNVEPDGSGWYKGERNADLPDDKRYESREAWQTIKEMAG